VFAVAERVLWTETKMGENNHQQLPHRLLKLVCQLHNNLPPFPSNVDSWPRWGFPEASRPDIITWHGVGVIDKVRMYSAQYGNYVPYVPPKAGTAYAQLRSQSAVHVFVVSCDKDNLNCLHNDILHWGLSPNNPPFLIYIDEPCDIAKKWKLLFQDDFWFGDYLGYHWKYEKDDVVRCFAKLTGAPPMNLPTEKAIRPTNNSYVNFQWQSGSKRSNVQ
jgi:hypothetical protein